MMPLDFAKIQECPVKIYKYHSFSTHTLASYATRTLWASHPTAFNDPFEFALRLNGSKYIAETREILIRRAIEKYCFENHIVASQIPETVTRRIAASEEVRADNEIAEHLPELVFGPTSVICFSRTSTNLLMWAHYTQSHRGFCAEFAAVKVQPYAVQYEDEIPQVDFEDKTVMNGPYRMLLTKSSQWSYEQELRMLLFEQGPKDFPGKLSKIIFGVRSAKSDRDLLRQVINDPDVEYEQANLGRDKYELEFTRVP